MLALRGAIHGVDRTGRLLKAHRQMLGAKLVSCLDPMSSCSDSSRYDNLTNKYTGSCRSTCLKRYVSAWRKLSRLPPNGENYLEN